ncbi:MAG TPA: C1 family peptidase, partial [Bacteroidales bacterium]|nr:C1 family peptidase [Bacteroidales bacterium]
MKKTFLLCSLMAISLFSYAQTLDANVLQELRTGFVKDSRDVALQNVLTGDANITKNAKNREVAGKTDHFFKYRVPVKGITNQYSSGRCWMFTSLNVLRPEAREMLQT